MQQVKHPAWRRPKAPPKPKAEKPKDPMQDRLDQIATRAGHALDAACQDEMRTSQRLARLVRALAEIRMVARHPLPKVRRK